MPGYRIHYNSLHGGATTEDVEADDYQLEKDWFVFTRSEVSSGDGFVGVNTDKILRVKAETVNRIEALPS